MEIHLFGLPVTVAGLPGDEKTIPHNMWYAGTIDRIGKVFSGRALEPLTSLA